MRNSLLALLAIPGALLVGCEVEEEPELEEPVVQEPVLAEPVAQRPVATPEPMAQADEVNLSEVMANPSEWSGKSYEGEVKVSSVPTDRGFWIEDQGQKIFAILIDQPSEVPVDINEGQTLRIKEATIRDPSYVANLEGRPLTDATKQVLQEQQVFIVVDEADLEIMAQAGEME